ncbi:Ankyrin repeat and death domain-containing protein 1B [Nymphaea thermarum]|nr:Ankyrin repeat and death domain-containing protein 1B [Nymphaea thermarum]
MAQQHNKNRRDKEYGDSLWVWIPDWGLPYSPTDPELHECSLNADVDFLKQLILRDEHVLERSEKGNNILHIAAIYGHVDFAREALNAKPDLSSELNEAGVSPLHLAASKGHLDLVKLFLAADPELSSLKDKHERTDKGETVLHLSVKENRIRVVEFLTGVEEIKSTFNDGDGSSNTALHLAAATNRKEAMNALNKYNVTVYDLIRLREANEDDEIVRLLNPQNTPATSTELAVLPSTIDQPTETPLERAKKAQFKQAGNAMIVAILIGTVTFKAAVPSDRWHGSSLCHCL